MNKEAVLKWEIFIGVILSYLIIIGASIYFFISLNNQIDENAAKVQFSQEKMNGINDLNRNTLANLQLKNRYLLNGEDRVLNSLRENFVELESAIKTLKLHSADYTDLKIDMTNLEAILANIFNPAKIDEQALSPLESRKEQLLSDQTVFLTKSAQIRDSLLAIRVDQNLKFHKEVKALENMMLYLIGLPLIFILFTLNRVLQMLKRIRLSAAKTKKLNIEIENATKTTEDANWILSQSTLLNETISGVDDENKIGAISFEKLLQTIKFYAGAIYIRKTDSYEYHLKKHIGIDKDKEIKRIFLEGESLLGHVTLSKEIKVITNRNEHSLHSSTSLLENPIKQIILVPLVYEEQSLGIIEIGGDFEEEHELPKILTYLKRVSRSIAMSIKFGQSHTLVENLLEETQQQTEELEAQQEELRITNEELVYKTNLLEASEEELRVQQEELQQSNEELEEKAKQLELRNIDLNAAQQVVEEKIKEIEQASKYKSEFMANMSHELRTPLNSILILAKLLQDNKTKTLNTDQIKYAAVIHSAGSDLLQLINELLDLAKIESGKVELYMERIAMKDFIDNMENLFATTAQEKEIDFQIQLENDIPEGFISDEYRMEQVLKNFLSNAFKFTEKNGKVTLTVSADQDNFKFAVIDTGKGISEEKQNLIFEAFLQEDGSTSRKYGGTGLGLSISKEIAALLGGRISLQSEIGVGSTFTLIIPYKAPVKIEIPSVDSRSLVSSATAAVAEISLKESPIRKSSAEENNHLQKNLLIIEDDINFADILKDFAEANGFSVMLAYDGSDGINKAIQFRPTAIILDVMLPISDGWQVLKTLKSDPETKHIPIHMMSAANFNQREFIEHGAIGFMAKPVSEESIRKAFENINLNIKKGIKKILLIEDQEFQSELIKLSFAEHNINVIQAFSAQSALFKLEEEENIDCIILDIKLPDANGLQVLETIKSMDKYAETPIIINTAYDLTKDQIDQIHTHTKALVLKSGKSNSRLIDEVTLFLNKISSADYSPVRNLDKIERNTNKTDSLHGKRVLIADDDMRNVFALTTTLQEYNMEIEIANNGLEAVEIVENPALTIDIVLMDIMMPEMDGYEAIQKIRENKKNAKLPIIAVTAKAMKGDRDKSIQIGASDYVSKPIDIEKLISLMRVWLS